MQASTSNHPNGHHAPELLVKEPQEVNEDLLGQTFRTGPRFRMAVGVLAALTVLGVVGFIIRLDDGLGEHTSWGYLAAAFAFITTTGMSAPMVAIAPRLAKAHFNKPISRAAELWAVAGLFNLLIFVPLLISLPSAAGRRTFWFTDLYRDGWPPGAPHVWLTLGIVFLVINGLALLWAGAIPDLAAARDRPEGARRSFYRRMALSWQGTARQWRLLRTAIGVLGAFYFIFLVFVHTIVSFDFAQSLVPGWRDSIFPTHHALSGLQSALATVLVTMFLLRTFGGMKEYIGLNQFWSLAKLLLATSLLWAYFWWSGFIVFWYGRSPVEQNILHLFMVGPYKSLFFTTFALNFLVPLFFLIWSPIRKSILGPTLIACSILVGTFLDRIRIYVASYSVGLEDQPGHWDLHALPSEFSQTVSAVTPDVADVFMVIGALAGAILFYLLAMKIIPVVNIWEIKQGLLLQRVRPLNKVDLKVLAKPE